MNLAVGARDFGQPANLMYIGVLAVGIIGAIIARFRPHGMVRALIATALAQALVAVIALIAGLGYPASPPLEILGANGFFFALFVGSALFRYAGRSRPPRAQGRRVDPQLRPRESGIVAPIVRSAHLALCRLCL